MNYILRGCGLHNNLQATVISVPVSTKRIDLKAYKYKKPIVHEKPVRVTEAWGLHKALCAGRLRVSSGPTFTTQIRWTGDCPNKKDFVSHTDIRIPNFDFYRKEITKDVCKARCVKDEEKRGSHNLTCLVGLLGGVYSAKTIVTQLVSSMAATADVLALATIEVDLNEIVEGRCVTVKWRGKPLFVKHRSAQEIEREEKTSLSELRDPEEDSVRFDRPEWLVVIGICTHLGCVPIPDSGDYVGGFYCPCHGSHYDGSGRIRKGPAPLNLEVPPHQFLEGGKLLIG